MIAARFFETDAAAPNDRARIFEDAGLAAYIDGSNAGIGKYDADF